MIFFTYFCIAQRRCNNFLLLRHTMGFVQIFITNLHPCIVPQIAVNETLQKFASTFDQQVLNPTFVEIEKYFRENLVVINDGF